MNLARTLVLITLFGFLSALGVSAHPSDHAKAYNLTEELVVPGQVDTILTGEQLVRLKTEYGALIEVPMSSLEMFSSGDAGYLELEPGQYVQARTAPGLLGVTPADNGRIWVKVDNEQVVKLYPNDLNDDLFLDDEREVEVEGRRIDMSLAELLNDEVIRLEIK